MKIAFLQRLPPRWRKWLPRLVAGLLVYTVFGFLVLPAIVKWQLRKQLPSITHRQATVRQVLANPFALSLTVRGLELAEPDGSPFASWDEFHVNFELSSLFRWAWTFKEIRLVKPFGEIIIFKDGRLNLANLSDAPTNAPPPVEEKKGSVPRINIFSLQITNGFVAFEDRTRRTTFRTEYRPINLNLTGFTTRPGEEAPYSFHAESDAGRSLTWSGDLSFQPISSKGTFEVNGVNFSRYQPYLDDLTRAQLTNGLADVQLAYRLEVATNGFDLVVSNGVVRAEKLQLLDPQTGEMVVSVEGLTAQDAGFDFRKRDVHVGSVVVKQPTLLTRLSKDWQFNLLGLLAVPPARIGQVVEEIAEVTIAPPKNVPPESLWTIRVDDMAIEQGSIAFEDLTRRSQFQTQLKPIEMRVKRFTTRTNEDAEFSFNIATESAEALSGGGIFSINPVRSSGEVKLTTVEVKKYLPYGEDVFRGRISAGKLEMQAPYKMAIISNTPAGSVSNLAIRLTNLEIKSPDGREMLVSVPELALEGIDASMDRRTARLGRVKTSGGTIVARHLKDGSLNLLGLLAIPTNWAAAASTNLPTAPRETATAPEAAASHAAWAAVVGEIALDNYTIRFEDQQPAPPASFLLDQFALKIRGASTTNSAPMQINTSLRLNESGSIAVHGSTRLVPFFAEAEVNATNLDLRAIQPYLAQQVRLDITSGSLSTGGQARFQRDAPRITFAGAVSLTNFITTDRVQTNELVRWDGLTITGIDAALEPNHAKIGEIKLSGLKANLIVGTDKKLNLVSALNKPGASFNTNPPPPAVPAPANPPVATKSVDEVFPVQLRALVLDNLSLALTDQSIQPGASFGIHDLSGTVKGLSSALNTIAEVDLSGRVDQNSPFAINGRINPLASDLFLDLVLTNRNTQLTPFTPYMEKYSGYPLNRGRLSTSLRYHLEKNQLKAEHKIQIDQLTLGPRNNSPDATSLPVKLGVALLKDRHGRIDLDVPVSGSLNDPQFKVGPIILHVVMNMITKAAAAPFTLLGKLVGGGEELSFVEFMPGSTNAAAAETEKLGKLTKALLERPAVNLEIEGAIDPVRDRDALARTKLRSDLEAQHLSELSSTGKTPPSAGTATLDPVNYHRLLRARFVGQFGTNIAAVLQTNTLFIAATNTAATGGTNAVARAARSKPEEKRGLGKRILALFGLGGSKSVAEKQLSKADRAVLGQATPEVMEALLCGKIEVTPEDFNALMKARAQWVENQLLKSGEITAERLSILAPKPAGPNYRGECRSNLSLN